MKTPASASAHYRATKRGPRLKIRIITAETASFRTYRLDSVNPLHSPDSFIRRALASSGLQSAWTQARLPLGVDSEIDHNSVSEES